MLSILYEDNHIIVVIKPDGLESQSGKSFAPDMVSEIRKHLASHPQDIHKLTKETSTASKYPQPPYVGVIHRLDRPVSGIMVYAKNPKAAASLSTSLQQGKRAELEYKVLDCIQTEEKDPQYLSLVEIKLLTGRHHQIRVQFSGHGTPLYGDGKYGNNEKAVRKSLALCACHLKFKHPATGKIMDFQIKPDTGAFKLFSKSND